MLQFQDFLFCPRDLVVMHLSINHQVQLILRWQSLETTDNLNVIAESIMSEKCEKILTTSFIIIIMLSRKMCV